MGLGAWLGRGRAARARRSARILCRGGESLGAANVRASRAGWTRESFLPERGASGGSCRVAASGDSVSGAASSEGLRACVGASTSGLRHVSARRWTTRCAPSPARSDLPAFRPGARPLAQLGGPARRRRGTTCIFRRTLRGTWSSQRGALRGKRFACRRFRRIASRLLGQETGGSAQHRATFRTLPRKGGPARSFREGGFRRFLRPLFADGPRRKIFRQSLPCLCRSPLLPNVRPFFVRSSAPRFRRRLPSLRAAVDSAAFQTVT